MDKRTLLFVPAAEFFIEPCGFVGKDAGNDLDACFSQPLKAFAGNQRVWVFDRADDAGYTGVYEGFGAGRCFTLVAVWFERDVGCPALSTISGLFESDRFGVDNSGVDVSTLADGITFCGNYDTADEWIRTDQPDTFGGEFERTADENLVVRLCCCGFYDFFGFLALPRYFSSGLLVVISEVRLQLDTPSDVGSVECE